MKKKALSILLIIIMVVCFASALYYPIRYALEKGNNAADMDELRALRQSALENSADRSREEGEASDVIPTATPTGGSALIEAAVGSSERKANQATSVPTATPQPDNGGDGGPKATEKPTDTDAEGSGEPAPDATEANRVTAKPDSDAAEEPEPEETDRHYRTGSVPYIGKEQIQLDPEVILPQYREIYEQNEDIVGWLYVPGTKIDYPVLQSEEHDYYLRRDFYGEENKNGQLILDSSCDPWTPSYNLVITGHNMKTGDMFGTLWYYMSSSFWREHKTFTYDSLMREGTYVVFAAFYSADYDVDEEGFRYNANIQYKMDAELWLEEVRENRLYDTGVDVEFGDEIITLTTCMYHREDGRFVVVARRVREGEVIE